jgi:hypothetical protein
MLTEGIFKKEMSRRIPHPLKIAVAVSKRKYA